MDEGIAALIAGGCGLIGALAATASAIWGARRGAASTLTPTRDYTLAEKSKNYWHSTNHRGVIDADTHLAVVIGRLLAGTTSRSCV